MIFQREDQCKGGDMQQFVHILRTEKDEMVQANATRFATKLDLKKFKRLLWPSSALWCMNMKNLKHLRERKQVVPVVKMKNSKSLLLNQLFM